MAIVKNKGGRPKGKNNLTEKIEIRLTIEQKEELEKLAVSNNRKVADYVRLLIIEKIKE